MTEKFYFPSTVFLLNNASESGYMTLRFVPLNIFFNRMTWGLELNILYSSVVLLHSHTIKVCPFTAIRDSRSCVVRAVWGGVEGRWS